MSRATPYNQGHTDAQLRLESNEDMPLSDFTDLLAYLHGIAHGALESWNKLNPDKPAIKRITFATQKGTTIWRQREKKRANAQTRFVEKTK